MSFRIKYAQYVIAECLKSLGFSIAAANAKKTTCKKLLRKYAEQVIKQSERCWTEERKERIYRLLKDLL